MKLLIALSVVALSSMSAFAGNEPIVLKCDSGAISVVERTEPTCCVRVESSSFCAGSVERAKELCTGAFSPVADCDEGQIFCY